ncbi:unnamed protein product [Brachionus calyciflorus]|uniref:Uncharacterized protein n=1 Tax=Brachionus calyciflorus TaxID=104777 RepID=A0A813WPX9_9BILA|nr:unnamed protein product [Brachionus calyciflorus]
MIRACYFILIVQSLDQVLTDRYSASLLEDLLKDYDSVVRPVENPNDNLKVFLGIKLSQIADIDERNQIMTTNVWIRHEWTDYKLKWEPEKYGNITKIKIPTSKIWTADVVLYNNADGDYHVSTQTKATVHYDGRIIWEPPMIYKSYCSINIEYYPFDIQDCYMKFGTWTFNGGLIDLEHLNKSQSDPINYKLTHEVSTQIYTVETGIDMSDYYESVEWDILSIPAQKNVKYYDCCIEPFVDIHFNITLRRKTLFYTVNLIIPCVNISFLSVLVFYLPSSSGEKITLGIYVLVALLVFYLLLIELIPPTSLVIPLLGKYLLFTLILVNLSILLSIFILNLHHRNPKTHKMPLWMRNLLLEVLPKYLFIKRPNVLSLMDVDEKVMEVRNDQFGKNEFEKYPGNIKSALLGMNYIQEKMRQNKIETKEADDWKYAAMVVDRLLLVIFSVTFFVGTFGILLKAPSIYDSRLPIGKQHKQETLTF